MSVERRTARRTPRPTPKDLLSEALGQARLAYEFAPGSYAFSALAAITNVIERMRAPDWIAEFTAYENLGTSACFADSPEEPHPAAQAPTE